MSIDHTATISINYTTTRLSSCEVAL